jgi:hypothetical protein
MPKHKALKRATLKSSKPEKVPFAALSKKKKHCAVLNGASAA